MCSDCNEPKSGFWRDFIALPRHPVPGPAPGFWCSVDYTQPRGCPSPWAGVPQAPQLLCPCSWHKLHPRAELWLQGRAPSSVGQPWWGSLLLRIPKFQLFLVPLATPAGKLETTQFSARKFKTGTVHPFQNT